MIADSSSKSSQRENPSASLATALRDKRPCVIPVQPNHSLPLRPVPPSPMRSSLILKPAVLKLSKPLEMEKTDMDAAKSSATTATTTTTTTTNLLTFANEDLPTFHFGEPARLENFVAIAFRPAEGQAGQGEGRVSDGTSNENGPSVKRRIGEENEKVGTKESKKKKKSHEADSSQSKIDGEFSRNSSADKSGKTAQIDGQEARNERGYGAVPAVVSTTDDNLGKDKESAKTVPPLRLKKVVCEGTGEGNRTDEVSAVSRNETNYRIVTGGTPQPPASVPTSTILFWTTTTSVINEQRTFKLPTIRLVPQDNNLRRSTPKNDNYKLKYRRNRLKQKLRELRSKRIVLDQQMANVQETNSLQSTRLKQMMNCNEKQMENLSKLLKKLCDTTAAEKVVEGVDEGDGGNLENAEEKENARENIDIRSPEPPKLSPCAPLDYTATKSPRQLRDSPPVLPRVCLTIPSNLGNDLVENVRLSTPVSEENAWPSPERSPSHLSIVLDASDEENPGPSVEDTLTRSTPVASSSGQGLSMPIIDTEGSEAVNANEVMIVNRPEENTDACTIARSTSKSINPGNPEVVPSGSDDIAELFGFTLPEAQGNSRFSQEASNASNLVASGLDGAQADVNNANEIYAQIVPTLTVQQQVSTVGNTLQNQTNHYESAVTQENVLGAGFAEHQQNLHIETSSSSQPVTIDSSSTIFSFDQTNSTSDICQPRSIPAEKGNEETIESESHSRTNESRIMAEQFPTLGNWVKARTKNTARRHAPKVKSKKTPDVLIATTSEDTTRILDTSKAASSSANIPALSIAVNPATPQWNAERWQYYQQRQQRPQQQLLQQVPMKTGQPLPPRPGICPPISVTQFYPTNYAIELYENPAFRYHSTICPCNNYQCRLHSGISISGGYHPTAAALRPAPHIDKRMSPLVSQESMRQHYTADMLKYHSTLPAGGYHPNSLDYERCRAQNNARNGATVGCLSPLLLPPPPPPTLATSTQQSLPRTSLSGLADHNVQYGRNRIIPDVVAAAAAAAVAAAASLGQQNNSMTPCNRPDRDGNASGVIPDFISGESSRLCKTNGNCDRLTSASQVNGTEDSRLNGGNVYQNFRNLDGHGNRVNVDGSYTTTSTFANNVSATVADVAACQMTSLPAPRMQDVARNEPMNNQTLVYNTPNLEKVGRNPTVANVLQCSNCGLPGSLFKCLGCETAFYCNERCQERHWIVHGEKCPKKMPKLKKVA